MYWVKKIEIVLEKDQILPGLLDKSASVIYSKSYRKE